jgi:hypothetical protein
MSSTSVKSSDAPTEQRTPMVFGLIAAAIALLIAVYFVPIWWVSLTAPNYPPEAFPDGVRIHFHMNGVFNGCEKVEKAEIQEDEALDCVHEMDTINHYVGMYPIAAGGVVERAFSPFIVALFAVMLVGFALRNARLRLVVLGIGFAAITVWMLLTYYGGGGLRLQSGGYVEALVTSLDQDAGSAEVAKPPGAALSPGEALIAQLKAELEGATDTPSEGASPDQSGAADGLSQKERLLENLRVTYERDQQRRPANEREPWAGSGSQVLGWHYAKSLGRYFNNPAEIRPMAAAMSIAGHGAAVFLIAAMLLLLWGARRSDGLLYWLLILVPMALPLFFLIDYSAWLWWYGHNLNDMGAFTVKPFMPTVFGDGKVAQFSTHSYPYWGFGLMLVASVLLALAALLRRKQLREARS